MGNGTVSQVFKDLSPGTPCIFILSTGADPTSMLQRFAEKKGWAPGERLHMISLGQGQGPIAEMLISQANKTGDWVCLQVSQSRTRRVYYYLTQGKWEGCLHFTALLTTLVPPTRERSRWLRLAPGRSPPQKFLERLQRVGKVFMGCK